MFAPPKKTKQSWPHLQLGQDLTYKDLKRKKRFSLNIQDGWRKIVGHGHNHSDEITNNNEWTNMGIPFLIHLVDHKQTNPWKNNEIYICSQYLYLYIWGLTLFWGGDILGEYIFLETLWIWMNEWICVFKVPTDLLDVKICIKKCCIAQTVVGSVVVCVGDRFVTSSGSDCLDLGLFVWI